MTWSILGIDYGEKRIGLAVGDNRSKIAVPFDTLKNDKTLWQKLAKIIREEGITTAIIGIPYNLKGKETEQTINVQQFYTAFQKQFPKTTALLEDERYTSKIAKQYSTKKNNDASAAALILHDYLERNTPENLK